MTNSESIRKKTVNKKKPETQEFAILMPTFDNNVQFKVFVY